MDGNTIWIVSAALLQTSNVSLPLVLTFGDLAPERGEALTRGDVLRTDSEPASAVGARLFWATIAALVIGIGFPVGLGWLLQSPSHLPPPIRSEAGQMRTRMAGEGSSGRSLRPTPE